MAKNETENFRDRLSMIRQDGSRLPLFPAEVRGYWRKWRTLVQTVLIFIFILAPWIKINDKPLFLIDIPDRHFILFSMEFWAHDTPLLFFIVGLATVGLGVATALFGRIWCGWACPQTVFLDGVIRRIEQWTEGNHIQRRALAQEPMSLRKLWLKSLKWFLFFAFSFLLTHSLLAYFVGPDGVISMISSDPRENWTAFSIITITTALLFFDLAWFREQFCLIVCPYGRIQAVLIDNSTINVQYDVARGEPRKGTPLVADQKTGDCISCNRCVIVCPTGIDIRNGLQMECIGCTACIDACDEIMEKVKKPKGLIRYMADEPKPKLLRPRIYGYLFLCLLFLGGLIYSLTGRENIEISVLRAIGAPYFEMNGSDGQPTIANSYRLHAHNQSGEPIQIEAHLALQDQPTLNDLVILKMPNASLLKIQKNEFKMIPFLITAKKENVSKIPSVMKIQINGKEYEVKFVKPSN